MAVVDDGVLKSWFLDSATGRELGLPTTGHALARRVFAAVARTDQSASRGRHAHAAGD